jgi:hypothetical protein
MSPAAKLAQVLAHIQAHPHCTAYTVAQAVDRPLKHIAAECAVLERARQIQGAKGFCESQFKTVRHFTAVQP